MTHQDSEGREVRYSVVAHKIQTMVMFGLQRVLGPRGQVPDTHECSPKHLRVGVESALASSEGLADLLVAKGLITPGEVADAIVEALETRSDARELRLRAEFPNLRFQ